MKVVSMKLAFSAVFAAALASAALVGGTTPGHATTDEPWCIIYGGGEGAIQNCSMRTFEECRQEMIGGNRGSCFQNPRSLTNSIQRPGTSNKG